MERGLDQLIFFAFIVLAALVDWVVRVIRNRNAPPQPPVEDEEVVYYEDEAGFPEQETAPQWQEPPRVETMPYETARVDAATYEAPRTEASRREVQHTAPPTTHAPPPERAFDAPIPADWRRIVEVQRHEAEGSRLPLSVAPPVRPAAHIAARARTPRAPAPSRAAPHGNRWRNDVLWLKDAGAARRAIVMMAVLGPCRALEDQQRVP